MPVMAYCPLGEGALLRNRRLGAIAAGIGASSAQVALAWLMRAPDVIAIPESANVDHVRENRAAGDIALSEQTLAGLDAVFPPPARATPLAVV